MKHEFTLNYEVVALYNDKIKKFHADMNQAKIVASITKVYIQTDKRSQHTPLS